MINRIIGKLVESDNALVDRKRVNIREALNKIDCEHYTDFLNLYECANLPLDKKKALAQELVKEEVDLKVIESFFDEDGYADAMEDGYLEDRTEQDVSHTYDGNLKEGDIYYTITVFEEKGKYGHSLEPSSPEDAFDELYFTSPSEAQEYADKHYPNAYSIMIRENIWNEGERTFWVSGSYLQRLNGEWKLFSPNSIKESAIPRNAKTITATSRYDGTSRKLTKKDGVWSDGKQGYANDFLRNNYDIKVDEIDKDYKPKRTKEVVVLQGNYGYGWDDLITYEKGDPDIRADLKSYRENEPSVAHRVIYRRIPVDTQE